jgi:putative addiction module component (TIGR02574 family)
MGDISMNPTLAELLDLGVPEKLELVEALWDSLADIPEELPVSDWQKEELAARRAAFKDHPESAILWDEAREKIRRAGC